MNVKIVPNSRRMLGTSDSQASSIPSWGKPSKQELKMNRQRWQDWVTTLIGIHVFFSPWIIPYFFAPPQIAAAAECNHLVVGAVIATVGVAALASYQVWQEWVELALGVWLVVAPWAYGFSHVNEFAWNSVFAGILLTLLSAAALSGIRALGSRR